MHLLSLLCLLVASYTSTSTVVKLLQQENVEEPIERYDRTNRVFSQKFTDIEGIPLLAACDDFVIRDTDDCSTLLFDFNTIRTRDSRDPDAITLQLFYHNESTNKPCEEAFFERHYIEETIWLDVPLSVPATTSLSLSKGDANEGPEMSVVFDLNNLTLFPRNKRLWVSMYATMAHHHNQARITTNNMMWITLNHRKGSTPLLPTFFGTDIENMNYYYRDKTNFLRKDFTQWTDATEIQYILGIHTETYNMAWRLNMICGDEKNDL